MYLLHISILLPIAAGIGIAFMKGLSHRFHLGWAVLIVPLILFAYFLSMIPDVRDYSLFYESIPWIPSLGIYFTVYLDGLSLLLSLLITGIGTLVVLYSVYYMERGQALHRFYLYLLLFMGAMLGVVLSDNMMVLYGFWELTSIASFLLIAFHHSKEESIRGAQKSFLVTVFGGFAMLTGFIMLYLISGSYSIRETIESISYIDDHSLFIPALILILIGAFTKSAQFPFHIWLPDAMEAPTPVSAYLHSATMVKAGIYIVARYTPVFGGEAVWFWLVSLTGILTMAYGSLIAIKKTDLKAILAYSTISQLGLIMSLFGLGSAALYFGYGSESLLYTTATTAGILHLFNHALFKGSLFMMAGIVDHETGTRDIRKLGGLMAVMPVTFSIALIGTFSMAGLPPFNGFVSKEMFFKATLEITELNIFNLEAWGLIFPILAWIASVMTFIYSLVIVFRTFLGTNKTEIPVHKLHEAPIGMLIPPVVLALMVLITGVYPDLLSGGLIEPAMASVLSPLLAEGERFDVHLYLWHGITSELWMTLGVVILGGVIYKFLPRWKTQYEEYIPRYTVNRFYSTAFRGLHRFAKRWTQTYMNGSLRNYLIYIFGFMLILIFYAFWRASDIQWNFSGYESFMTYENILLAGLIITALCIPIAKHRLSAVILTGAVGYLVTLFFVLFRAPDLALTQMVVETVSVALFLLCFYHLPELTPKSSRKYQALNLVIAIGVGVMVTLIALAASGTPQLASISEFFTRESYNLAGGKNIVNVLLVDFRGFDTLLEIMVLGVAALAIYSMINLNLTGRDLGSKHQALPKKEKEEEDQAKDKSLTVKPDNWNTVPLRSNDVFLQMSTKIIVFIILVFALYLFFAGHHQPGGGFISGLVTSASLVLMAIAFNTDTLRRILPVDYRYVIAWGLLISLATAAGSFLFGVPFMSQTFDYFDIPILGEVELTTALIFEAGVFMSVVGVTMTIILQIGEDR
ncbi:Na+/H+ antiporter subunit A [Paenibacillus provencensis]|uniref:Na+/H+ antiporter subunit A n=1 Tax=Paenibacillus provencensis TaxID=441151 RepID=A0ABW3Q4B8_9BACL|nr:Na+/H+ antiporter subunit A [Paenibacillus sp. MER 78]MCM3130900.1 Na+/H+ antiporter subunit A [Paenibacillus sp. MER 78]